MPAMERRVTQDELPARWLSAGLELAWQAIRLPVLAVLLVLEPFVTVAASVITLLLILCALFFGKVVHAPHFPFWGMMLSAVIVSLLRLGYQWAIALLATR